jgi:hypothetical protein
MIYAINYDLKEPGRDYVGLYEAIKGCGAWWHYLESTWLVDTNLDAEGIWKRLSPHFDENDRALVIGVTKNYQGWLPNDAWEWINDRRDRAAA